MCTIHCFGLPHLVAVIVMAKLQTYYLLSCSSSTALSFSFMGEAVEGKNSH